MKIVCFISVLLLPALSVFGQRRRPLSPCEAFPMTARNADSFYVYAKSLMEQESLDSLRKANRILIALGCFDSRQYSFAAVEHELNAIEENARTLLYSCLEGSWNWRWNGSNWGTDETPDSCHCTRSVVFQGRLASFYTNDSLTRSTRFSIEKSISSPFERTYFLLRFEDLEEHWDFWLYPPGHFVPYLYRTTARAAMLVNKDPSCACGCPESVFEKSNAVLPGITGMALPEQTNPAHPTFQR
jgi:hypothetical protein